MVQLQAHELLHLQHFLTASQPTWLLNQKPQSILPLLSSSSTPNQLPNPTDSTCISPKSTCFSLSLSSLCFSRPLIFSRPICLLVDHPVLGSRTPPSWNILCIAGSQQFFEQRPRPAPPPPKLKNKTKQKPNQGLSHETDGSLGSQRSREPGHFHFLSFPEY